MKQRPEWSRSKACDLTEKWKNVLQPDVTNMKQKFVSFPFQVAKEVASLLSPVLYLLWRKHVYPSINWVWLGTNNYYWASRFVVQCIFIIFWLFIFNQIASLHVIQSSVKSKLFRLATSKEYAVWSCDTKLTTITTRCAVW